MIVAEHGNTSVISNIVFHTVIIDNWSLKCIWRKLLRNCQLWIILMVIVHCVYSLWSQKISKAKLCLLWS